MKIGCMVWRIGEILDFYEQLSWISSHGFEAVSFHTVAGVPNRWEGFGVREAKEKDIEKLRCSVKDFSEVSLHAPFESFGISLISPDLQIRESSIAEFGLTIRLAGLIGAEIVTIHTGSSTATTDEISRQTFLRDSLLKLEELASPWNVRIGVELTSDYELVEELNAEHIGITIDTGHLSFEDGAGYREYGSIGGVIRRFSQKIFHVHVHDYDGEFDHITIGRGIIDFDEIVASLTNIGFKGSLCLELNPDREPPEEILRSRDKLQELIEKYAVC